MIVKAKRIIRSVTLRNKTYKLIKPYVLSFGTIGELLSIQTCIELENGEKQVAEVVPLVGYSDETGESINRYLVDTINRIENLELEQARVMLEKDIPEQPFACSPLLTCIDLFDTRLEAVNQEQIPFVVPASALDIDGLENVINGLLKKKGGTVKIKLSGNVADDIRCIEFLSTLTLTNVFIRFDANKAYDVAAAVKIYEALEKMNYIENVHYVEQPLPVGDWEGHANLVKRFALSKTMLDESIITEQDLLRAIDLDVPFVKFKLFKQGGIDELIRLSALANDLGRKVVIGNGVATEMSNRIENAIYHMYPHLFFGASEANGFLKLSAQ